MKADIVNPHADIHVFKHKPIKVVVNHLGLVSLRFRVTLNLGGTQSCYSFPYQLGASSKVRVTLPQFSPAENY